MTTYRTGRWSNDEIAECKRLVEEGLGYEQISIRLNRPADTVQSLVEGKLLLNISDVAKRVSEAERDIKQSPEWKELVKQMSPEEQDTFLHHWREIIIQFDGDVLHTEKLQVIDTIRNEILINRVMARLHISNSSVHQLQTEYEDENAKDPSIRDVTKLRDLQQKIGDYIQGIASLNKEYKDLMERKQNILKDIKGTRAERIKRIEDSKESITGWVASLLTSSELRQQLGRDMEKFRIATKVEYERLSDYHTYDDKSVEQPILDSDTLKEDNF